MSKYECDVCGPINTSTTMLKTCKLCHRRHCPQHLLPENHSCPGLKTDSLSDWIDYEQKFQHERTTSKPKTDASKPARQQRYSDKTTSKSEKTRRLQANTNNIRQMSIIGKSIYRLSGKTTFRHPSYTTFERLASVFFYPLAIIGAIIQPIIWLSLVTAFSPLRGLTPYISFIVEWFIFVSIIFALLPASLLTALPDIFINYHQFVSSIIDSILQL